jgi:hypothetical protein
MQGAGQNFGQTDRGYCELNTSGVVGDEHRFENRQELWVRLEEVDDRGGIHEEEGALGKFGNGYGSHSSRNFPIVRVLFLPHWLRPEPSRVRRDRWR